MKTKAEIVYYQRQWYRKNRIRLNERQKIHNAARKLRALLLVQRPYSYNHIPTCAHCGFTDIRALAVDHIHGYTEEDGPRSGARLYNWLISNEIKPDTFQVLCRNCNWIKEHNGVEGMNDSRIEI